jgi:hypothetical protein
VIVPDEQPGRIRVSPLAGGSPRDVRLDGWSGLYAWTGRLMAKDGLFRPVRQRPEHISMLTYAGAPIFCASRLAPWIPKAFLLPTGGMWPLLSGTPSATYGCSKGFELRPDHRTQWSHQPDKALAPV